MPDASSSGRGGVVRSATFPALDTPLFHDLVRLRLDVFVVEQGCAYRELDGRDTDPSTVHVWAGEPPVGYLRLLTEPDGTRRIGRVCVAAGHRGSGLAGRLVATGLELAGGHVVVLDAQAHLESWYAQRGFARSGAEFVEDGIAHVPMRREPGPVS